MAAHPVFLLSQGFQRGRGDAGDSVGAAATCISAEPCPVMLEGILPIKLIFFILLPFMVLKILWHFS